MLDRQRFCRDGANTAGPASRANVTSRWAINVNSKLKKPNCSGARTIHKPAFHHGILPKLAIRHTQGRTRINEKRLSQLEAAKPETVVVSCPFCMTMIEDAVKSRSEEDPTVILDLAEVIAKSAGIR